jgi:hypothetical protein
MILENLKFLLFLAEKLLNLNALASLFSVSKALTIESLGLLIATFQVIIDDIDDNNQNRNTLSIIEDNSQPLKKANTIQMRSLQRTNKFIRSFHLAPTELICTINSYLTIVH